MAQDHRILVVADDSDQRALFQLLLTQAGYPVVAAEDGASALAHLRAERFDLLLTDYFLPDILGDQLIHQVREEGIVVKVVLMSNHVDVNALARACHADGCFRKEDCRQLLVLVRDLSGHDSMSPPH